MKIYIEPHFEGIDKGDGGIRRVVEAQKKWLPQFGHEVVSTMEEADLVATHAGNLPKVPIEKPWVVHTHGLYWSEYKWDKWSYEVNRRVIEAMRRADCVTAPSEWVAMAIARGSWIKAPVLYHGVDLEDWAPGDHGNKVIWNKTRTDPVCDATPLLDLARLAPEIEIATTFFPGEPPKNVEVLGKLSYEDGKAFVKQAAVYLCTTRETFGIGTIEAMAAGVPIVGWNWGGQAEIIRHKETGWLAQPGDIGGLVDGIKWALENRAAISEAARADVAKRWTWKIAMERTVQLYKDLFDKSEKVKRAPRVSVVIPCYKLAHLVPDALKSLQAQTMPDWEAIVVDDASPDDVKRALEPFKTDARIKYKRNAKNLYLAGALNRGIADSLGRYVVPLDADNMLEPHTLEILSNALDKDRGIAITYGAVRFVKEDGKTPDETVGMEGRSPWPMDFSFAGQITHKNQLPSTSMYRRAVWERTGGYRKRCRTAEDAEFWTRATSLGFWPQKVTSAPTLIYRQMPNSMSRVNADWDWTAWFPWSRKQILTPMMAAMEPPAEIGKAWLVPSAEPVVVSVIVPVGPGHEDLLIDALDSIEAQSYRQWEVVVINDTGKPLTVPHAWARVISTKGREGVGAARNLGIETSRGRLFVPLDADDFLQPEALERLVKAQQEFGGTIYSQWWDDKGTSVAVYDPDNFNAHNLLTKGCIHAVTGIYERASWKKAGGFDPTLKHWEDWDFQIRLASVGVCGTKIAMPLFTYRKMTGARREANMASFDEGKAAMLKRWGKYFNGEEVLMACRTCGGSPPPTIQAPQNDASVAFTQASQRGDVVLLEFVQEFNGQRRFRGQKTGTTYIFDHGPLKRRYVFRDDVPGLTALYRTFVVVDNGIVKAEAPVLTIAGPPVPQTTQPMPQTAPPAQSSPTPVAVASKAETAGLAALPDMAKPGDKMALRPPTAPEPVFKAKGRTKAEVSLAINLERQGQNRANELKKLQKELQLAPDA